jgi:hypothetical protein
LCACIWDGFTSSFYGTALFFPSDPRSFQQHTAFLLEFQTLYLLFIGLTPWPAEILLPTVDNIQRFDSKPSFYDISPNEYFINTSAKSLANVFKVNVPHAAFKVKKKMSLEALISSF